MTTSTDVVEREVPSDMMDLVAEKRNILIGQCNDEIFNVLWCIFASTSERVAEVDEQLGEMFLSDTEPSKEELMVSNG